LESVLEPVGFALAERGEELPLALVDHVCGAGSVFPTRRRDLYDVATPVVVVRVPLNHSFGFEPVENGDQRGAVDPGTLAKLGLGERAAVIEADQRSPLTGADLQRRQGGTDALTEP
jgi:hypothetical protein